MYKPFYKQLNKQLYKSFYGVEDKPKATPLPTDMIIFSAALKYEGFKSSLTGAQLATAFDVSGHLIGNDLSKLGTLSPHALPSVPDGIVATYSRTNPTITTFVNMEVKFTREDGTPVTNGVADFSIHDSSEAVTDLWSEFSTLPSTIEASGASGNTKTEFAAYTLGQVLTGASIIEIPWDPVTHPTVSVSSMTIIRTFNGTDIEVLVTLTSSGSNKIGQHKSVKITPANT